MDENRWFSQVISYENIVWKNIETDEQIQFPLRSASDFLAGIVFHKVTTATHIPRPFE